MGNVIGDLNSRRGQITNQESQDGTALVSYTHLGKKPYYNL